MSGVISTHVLDTGRGMPGGGVAVTLERNDDGNWKNVGTGVTTTDGRIDKLASTEPGVYRLTFAIADYYKGLHQICFFPEIVVIFVATDNTNYHVPIVLSPYGYSTYKGS